jgi:hypothetical protein
MSSATRRTRAGEVAIVLLGASLAGAVRALGSTATAVMYAFAASSIVLVVWLFLFAG